MRMPESLPVRPRTTDQPIYAALYRAGLEPQFIDILDPKKLVCAAKCAPKAGYVACLARCLLDGQACDGGIDNCS